jgi:hypothetical protein
MTAIPMAEEKRERTNLHVRGKTREDKYPAQWLRKSGKRQISVSLLPQSSSQIFRDSLNPASQPKIPAFPLLPLPALSLSKGAFVLLSTRVSAVCDELSSATQPQNPPLPPFPPCRAFGCSHAALCFKGFRDNSLLCPSRFARRHHPRYSL